MWIRVEARCEVLSNFYDMLNRSEYVRRGGIPIALGWRLLTFEFTQLCPC